MLTDGGVFFLDLEWKDAFVFSEGLSHRFVLSLVTVRVQNIEHFPLGLNVLLVVLEAMQ